MQKQTRLVKVVWKPCKFIKTCMQATDTCQMGKNKNGVLWSQARMRIEMRLR